MRALLEIFAAMVLWAASVAFAQFGIELDSEPAATRHAPTARRTAPTSDTPAPTPAIAPCAKPGKARIHDI